MIDICPVGALTSKPFRYKARTWELTRRKSVSPHDGLGSNLVVQVKQNKVMRVLPLENEAINECWLSDKDRFSYDGLNSARPPAAPDGEAATASGRRSTGSRRSSSWCRRLQQDDFGVLASPHATLEELFLASKLGGPADFRLRHSDFSADGKRDGIPWLGMPIAELQKLDRVLVVGSFLRKDHPLIAHRLRQAAKRGTQIHVLHSVDDDWLMPIASKKIVAPSEIPGCACFVRRGAEGRKECRGAPRQLRPAASAGRGDPCRRAGAGRQGRFPRRSRELRGRLPGRACRPAATCADVLEQKQGLRAAQRRAGARLRRSAAPRARRSRRRVRRQPDVLQDRARVRRRAAADRAVHRDARAPSSTPRAACRASTPRCTRWAKRARRWKVLRVLGTLLGRAGFEFDTVEQVRAACLGGRDVAGLLSNEIDLPVSAGKDSSQGIQRIADVPIYFADPLVRRSPPLQKTRDARPPRAWMNAQAAGEARRSPPGSRCWCKGAVKLIGGAGRQAARRLRAHRRGASHDRGGSAPMFGALELARTSAEQGGLDANGCSPTVRPSGSARSGARRSTRPATTPRLHRRDRGAADAGGGLPHAVGAQAHRLDADPHRAEPRRARRACCSRSPTASSCCSRKSSFPPTRTRRLFLLAPIADDHAGARRLGGDPVRARSGARRHQRRACSTSWRSRRSASTA